MALARARAIAREARKGCLILGHKARGRSTVLQRRIVPVQRPKRACVCCERRHKGGRVACQPCISLWLSPAYSGETPALLMLIAPVAAVRLLA